MLTRLFAATTLFLATTSVALADVPPPQPCLTGEEAEALIVTLMPAAITIAGTTCATELPPNALLRQPNSGFVAKFAAIGDSAWSVAKSGLAKVAGPDVAPILDTSMGRPMVAGLIAPLLVKEIKPRDCAPINQILTDLAPLPPRNIANAVVTILQVARKPKPGEKDPLPICPFGQR